METSPLVPSPATYPLSAPVCPKDKRFLLTGIILVVSGVALGVPLGIFFGRDRRLESEQKELVEIQLKQLRDAKMDADHKGAEERANLNASWREDQEEQRKRAAAQDAEWKANDAEFAENQRVLREARERRENLDAVAAGTEQGIAFAKQEIIRLKGLRDKGKITQQQYDADIKWEGLGEYPH